MIFFNPFIYKYKANNNVVVNNNNTNNTKDSDGDGIIDSKDNCPNEYGEISNNGCPKKQPAKNDNFTEDHDGLGLDMVFVEGGRFDMGCTSEQKDCYDGENPVHSVKLSNYYIGKYEVTQRQWQTIMGNNPSYFKDCPNCPVEQVGWTDVQDFITILNPKTGKNYSLPTEAQWEYAARSRGQKTMFGNGKNIIDPNEINFDSRKDYKKRYSVIDTWKQKTIEVGSLNSPNSLSLHDMSGNVWEWCSDLDYPYTKDNQTNPKFATYGTTHIVRGGGWTSPPEACRTAYRGYKTHEYRYERDKQQGFRLALSAQ